MDREASGDEGGSTSIRTTRQGGTGASASVSAGRAGQGPGPGQGRKRKRKEQEEGDEPIKRYCHQCRGANNYARMFCSTCPYNYCSKCLVNRCATLSSSLTLFTYLIKTDTDDYSFLLWFSGITIDMT
jgi:hypothetical protein